MNEYETALRRIANGERDAQTIAIQALLAQGIPPTYLAPPDPLYRNPHQPGVPFVATEADVAEER